MARRDNLLQKLRTRTYGATGQADAAQESPRPTGLQSPVPQDELVPTQDEQLWDEQQQEETTEMFSAAFSFTQPTGHEPKTYADAVNYILNKVFSNKRGL
jgi:regulator of sirC expression with transglutaminase-like and TPR domain